jgi:hypothetical protein
MQRQRNSRQGNSTPARGMRLGNRGALSHPRQIHPAISGSKVIRYQSTSAATQEAITQQDISETLVVATSAVLTTRIFSSTRIRKIEMWSAPAQGSASSYLSVVGDQADPQNRVADTSMGVTPAHVVWRPTANSVADLWYQNQATSQVLCLITCPADTIIDMSFDFIMQCNDASIYAGPVPVGATPGVLYAPVLDQGGSGNFLPQDYPVLP